MNRPPHPATSVPAGKLRDFSAAAFSRCGVPEQQAALVADLLSSNDLRGVFSHGTRQTAAYVDHFRTGRLNPAPEVRVTMETGAALTVDGDGGLGYFPALEAASRLAAKAKENGVAVALTRSHGHIGAAGIYARVPLEQDLFCYVTSGHQLDLRPGKTVLTAAGGSPMAFALPTGEEPPFVLDFGAIHDMYPTSPHVWEIVRLAPGTAFRSLGLGAVCQALGGFLCGVPVDPARAEREWAGADQGSFMIAVDLKLFRPVEEFKREMDDYARRVRELVPLPGFDESLLPGTPEWLSEQRYAEAGVPVGPEHAAQLRRAAEATGIPAPL